MHPGEALSRLTGAISGIRLPQQPLNPSSEPMSLGTERVPLQEARFARTLLATPRLSPHWHGGTGHSLCLSTEGKRLERESQHSPRFRVPGPSSCENGPLAFLAAGEGQCGCGHPWV